MKPPPDCLPPANSPKWHSRRWWDSLGYVRVRTIANPKWQRDPDWLLRLLESSRPRQQGRAQELMDSAIAATKQYRGLRRHGRETDAEFAARRERQWDAILGPLDELLELRQRDHLRAVREVGRSGPQVPDV